LGRGGSAGSGAKKERRGGGHVRKNARAKIAVEYSLIAFQQSLHGNPETGMKN
jgi:hypothetical protein